MPLQPGNQILVLSDIHIGNNSPTCWYQKKDHEPYLNAVFDWIIDSQNSPSPVRQLILLGDLVDFWTYPANVIPPTFKEIIDANPNILGPNGRLAEALDLLEGEVHYLTGNHDMSVTQSDMAQLQSPHGFSPKFTEGAFFEPMVSVNGIAVPTGITAAHGHHYTLFNAPDATTPWAPMPIGHFVTRMVASMWAKKLNPGETVADLAGQGAPNGTRVLESFVQNQLVAPWIGGGHNASIGGKMLDAIATATEWDPSERFIVPGFSPANFPNLAEVKAIYANLWNNWVAQHGGGEAGAISAYKAALADAKAWYLGWFAQQVAFSRGSKQVVFGHTHEPISAMLHSEVDYINSGFQCTSIPDMTVQAMSFGVLGADPVTSKVMQAKWDGGGIKIEALDAPSVQPVPPPAMDYSCYVTLTNSQTVPMSLQSISVGTGYLAVPPPSVLNAGETRTFWLTDYPSFPIPHGSDCKVVYQSPLEEVPGGGLTQFAEGLLVDCPTGAFSNKVEGGQSFTAKSGEPNGPWLPPGQVPPRGHPLYVHFTL